MLYTKHSKQTEEVLTLNKTERLQAILTLLDEKNVVLVSELQKMLNVTEMTVRRDLNELEQQQKAMRIHGGAKKAETKTLEQLPHKERIYKNYDEKLEIAKKAGAFLCDDDIVFIGAGTTNELLYDHIAVNHAIVVTNCLYIFEQYVNDKRFKVILIGGSYNPHTESFLGNITLQQASMMNFTKAFIGTNGIYKSNLCASNNEEATLHKLILNHADAKYILCDSEKFGKNAFYSFFPCEDVTAIITDHHSIQDREELEKITNIL